MKKTFLFILTLAFATLVNAQEIGDSLPVADSIATAIEIADAAPQEAIDASTPTVNFIPSQGITFGGIVKGVIGIAVLLLVLVALSENRRAISWKLVGIGLAMQILIALGIQEVGFIGSIFEWISRGFVKILDFSKEGAAFIFGDLMDQSKFGYIFCFQVLPTIIFFSGMQRRSEKSFFASGIPSSIP